MPYEFFTISVHDDGRAAAELNAFMRTHRVLAVKRRWVDLGANSFWSFCIDYWQGAERSEDAVRGVSRNRVDYRESLSPDDFAVFARLRDWRKEIGQTEAVPVYTIFTNEQLAQMVQTKAQTTADLQKIPGVGEARLQKYGPRVLELLNSLWSPIDATRGKPLD